MSKILEALDKLAAQKYLPQWQNPAIKRYVQTGDAALLKQIPPMRDGWVLYLHEALPETASWTEEASRVLQLAGARNIPILTKNWLARHFRYGRDWDQLGAAINILRACGYDEVGIRGLLFECSLWEYDLLQPTPIARIYLEADDEEIKLAVQSSYSSRNTELAMAMAILQPDRLAKLIQSKVPFGLPHQLYRMLAKANPAKFAETAFEVFQKPGAPEDRLLLIQQLGELRPDSYLARALQETRDFNAIPIQDYLGRVCVEYLFKHNDPEAPAYAFRWMEGFKDSNPWNAPFQREMILKWAEANAPEHLLPMAKACARCTAAPNVIQLGLKYWRQCGVDSDDLYHEAVKQLLSNPEPANIVLGISEARDWDVGRCEEDLWPFMLHKSRPVRGAAARTLAGLGYSHIAKRALKLLEHKKAEIRQAAVMLLNQTGDPAATQELKARLDFEENDDVRDSILLALEKSGGGASFSTEEQQARIAKTLAKAKGPPAAWIDPTKIELFRQDGSALSADETLYLLIRQSRCKEMRADLEAKPIFTQLDRQKCAPASLALLSAFLGSKQDASDRWVLSFSALTGDDRLVPALRKSIIDWADNMRGKLAEYGVQALALLGSDPALMVVDSFSVKYRSKNKNIGQAASEAFAAAAEARGVSVEELGDLVVPWLGFEPNKPRVIEGSKAQVEARIGSDLKLTFRDVKTGKLAPKLPAGASAEIVAEFKLLSTTLKEAVKAQLLRIETLLVRQFRWPTKRWRELYLAHPLLIPFAQRLVWGWRDESGKLEQTFRALEDATLTDVEDNPVELPEEGSVSLIHPLDLDDETRSAWINHLADYEIAPPFAQLDRPVERVKPEEIATKFGTHVNGTELNALTFRSRAEKLGWVRGSVIDAGCVSGYRKVFSGSGVEAILGLEGMFIGVGMDDSIKLERFCFVKSGTVQTGSYTYDEPSDENDPRLIAFGEVPVVPFSEVMGDLLKIKGKEEATEEAQPA